MKPAVHSRTHSSLARTSPHVGLAFLFFMATALLVGCATLRLPMPTTDPHNHPATVAINTPTVALALLTPAPTNTLPPTLSASVASPTPTFGLPLPEPTCDATPRWGLGDVWSNDDVRTRLGCLVGEQIGIQGEEAYFQKGHMLWRPDIGLIYVIFTPLQPDGWGAFVDTLQPSDPQIDPAIVAPTSIAGTQVCVQPTGRFGKLWREHSWLRDKLGWAVNQYIDGHQTSVIRFSGVVQDFEGGALLWNGDVCFVLRTDDMSWTIY